MESPTCPPLCLGEFIMFIETHWAWNYFFSWNPTMTILDVLEEVHRLSWSWHLWHGGHHLLPFPKSIRRQVQEKSSPFLQELAVIQSGTWTRVMIQQDTVTWFTCHFLIEFWSGVSGIRWKISAAFWFVQRYELPYRLCTYHQLASRR